MAKFYEKFERKKQSPPGKKKDEKAHKKDFRSKRNSPEPKKNYSPRPKTSHQSNEASGLIRLNRFIANAGICSRREADELIKEGKIRVNGKVVTEMGHKIDTSKDKVEYERKILRSQKFVYLLLNKPKNFITTTEDEKGRRTVMELVKEYTSERIYPVGRLDRNTTGLLLFTNDGELAEKLTHPSHEIRKIYHVKLNKAIEPEHLDSLVKGFDLEDGFAKADEAGYVTGGGKSEIGIILHSGRNRIVRRMLEHLGYEVISLDRTGFANLTKKNLPRGKARLLSPKEVSYLKMR